jgi:hypothetical protein
MSDGDFNDDGFYDCTDVDALVANIVANTGDLAFDVDGNLTLDAADLSAWLIEAGAVNNPSGGAYLLGDANLDGVVDVSDFNSWNSNKFTSTASWCSGDFNADGVVDGSDFNSWNSNKFTSSDAAFRSDAVGKVVEEVELNNAIAMDDPAEQIEWAPSLPMVESTAYSLGRDIQADRNDASEEDHPATDLLDQVFGGWN